MPWEGLPSLGTHVESKHKFFASGMRKSLYYSVGNRPTQNYRETQQNNRNAARPSGILVKCGDQIFLGGGINLAVEAATNSPFVAVSCVPVSLPKYLSRTNAVESNNKIHKSRDRKSKSAKQGS